MLTGIPIRFEDGSTIFAEGDAAADLYRIRSGTVVLTQRDTLSGEDVEIARLGAGEFFGEMAVFDPGPRSATAIAVGDVDLEAIDRPTFLASMDDPEALELLAEMARRIRGEAAADG